MKKRREIRWIYKALLKPQRKVVNINNILGYYDRYETLRNDLEHDVEAPSSLKAALVQVKKPKYLQWISEYVI